MQDRLAAVDGTVQVHGASGRGTTVAASIAVDHAGDRADKELTNQ